MLEKDLCILKYVSFFKGACILLTFFLSCLGSLTA